MTGLRRVFLISFVGVLLGGFLFSISAQEKPLPQADRRFVVRAATTGTIRIGESVQVSASSAGLNHAEVIIAADPSNARHLLACSIVEPEQPSMELARTIAYVSFDGGTSWSTSLEFGARLWSSDPSCVIDPKGVAYYAALIFDLVDGRYKGKTVLYKSPDGGKTWSLVFTFPEEGDREFITLDAMHQRLYMVERYVARALNGGKDEGDVPLVLFDSDDGGKSFQTRTVLSNFNRYALPNNLVFIDIAGYPGGILSNGTFVTGISNYAMETDEKHASDPAAPPGKIWALLYNRNIKDDVSLSVVDKLYPCDPWANSITIPSLATDSSAGIFRDRIYVAWPDSRSGRCEILFSSSADRGKTWSKPITVNDDRTRTSKNAGPDDFHPVMAVSQKGVVGVLWQDRRDEHDNLSWSQRFSASLDGGQTFLPSVGPRGAGMKLYRGEVLQLNSQGEGGADPVHPRALIHTTFGYEGHAITGGETTGLASDATGAFHALWIDNRTGVRQIWTAQITVDGTATKNGSDDLAFLDDLSFEVAVLFADIKLDRTNQTLTANAYIQNVSQSDLDVPLKLRVLRSESKIGAPAFTNADNHQTGVGAVFDFGALVRGGILKPGQRSAAKQISVHFDDLPSEISPGDYNALYQMLTIESVVLGLHAVNAKPSATN